MFCIKKSCTRPEVKAAVKHVRQSGIDVDVYIPWSRKDLRRFVRQTVKDGAQRIVAGGGDGTLNAVVNAMIRGDIRPKASLGILPLGTANDFAKGAGIDAEEILMSALELACTGSPTKIDVGRMNDQYFINVASAGFGAEVTATTPQFGTFRNEARVVPMSSDAMTIPQRSLTATAIADAMHPIGLVRSVPTADIRASRHHGPGPRLG